MFHFFRVVQWESVSAAQLKVEWEYANRNFLGKMIMVAFWCQPVLHSRYLECGNSEFLVFNELADYYNMTLVSRFHPQASDLIQSPQGRLGLVISPSPIHETFDSSKLPLSKGHDIGIIHLFSETQRSFIYCQDKSTKDWLSPLNPVNLLGPFDVTSWFVLAILLVVAPILQKKKKIIASILDIWAALLGQGVSKLTLLVCIWSLSSLIIT